MGKTSLVWPWGRTSEVERPAATFHTLLTPLCSLYCLLSTVMDLNSNQQSTWSFNVILISTPFNWDESFNQQSSVAYIMTLLYSELYFDYTLLREEKSLPYVLFNVTTTNPTKS